MDPSDQISLEQLKNTPKRTGSWEYDKNSTKRARRGHGKHENVLKAALQIYERLTATPAEPQFLELPNHRWSSSEQLLKQCRLTQERGWTLAGTRCRRHLQHSLQELKREIGRLEAQLDTSLETGVPHLHAQDLLNDIRAIHHEFDAVAINVKNQTLTVTTEPITLEEVYLGPFEIELSWSTSHDPSVWFYRVIAADPHPAASDDGVIHPHVKHESLCEGEGTQPIQAALKQGRLFDFFCLVANILRTYNPGSPYVELEHWNGITCDDCGSLMSGDESHSCAACSTSFCHDCRMTCHDCEESFCLDCLQRCACCEESVCKYCIRACCDCHQQVCSECLTDQERCENCHEPETNDEDQTQEESQHAASDAEAKVQPDRLGQTAVSA